MIEWNRHYGVGLVREFIAALAFLSVLLLAFAHQPVQVDANSGWRFASVDFASSYCGDAPDGHGANHGPCHACRVAGTELPPPPCVATSAYADFDVFKYAKLQNRIPVHRIGSQHAPRAPPNTV